MWNITRKNVAANKVRLALTALAIVLGVGFISAANILSDGLRDSFGDLATEIVQGTDLEVRASDEDRGLNAVQVAQINEIGGVRAAIGSVEGWDNTVLPVKPDGDTISQQGPPQIAFGWIDDNQLNPSSIESGRAPEGPGEWVIDFTSAENHGFVIGETYDLVVPTEAGITQATLVGTLRFGQDNTTNGAVLMAMEATTAMAEFGISGNFDSIVIATDGSRAVADVQADVDRAIGPGFESLDNADLNSEQRAQFNSFINVFAWVLRTFAIVALFVSIFIIANTFNIVMSQRVRELGLLRAIGATPRQVQRAVVAEATVVGLVASVVGLAVGLGLAYGMEAALNAIGAELPSFGKPITVATAVIGVGVGVGVTVLSAWVPARKAGRVSPIAAISGHDSVEGSEGRRSLMIGALLSAVGAGLTGTALFGGIDSTANVLIMLGMGAAVLFVGITLLSPIVAAPISRTIGAPLRAVFRKPGALATENAARNPRRTATTAAALMIGLSLVSMAFVVGQSLKSDLNELLESTVQADYAAFGASESGLVPLAVGEQLAESDHLVDVAGMRYWSTDIDGVDTEVSTLPLASIDSVFDLGLTEGSYEAITDESLGLRQAVADDLGVGLGDSVSVDLSNGSSVELEVAALFDDGNIFEGALVTGARYETIGDQTSFDWVAASIAPGSTAEQAQADIDAVSAGFPQLDVQSAAGYRESISGQVDFLLQVLSGFLGLAILIAFIGIVNTMALSIFERTRELGLLRAVGMTRRQMHRMVRWEAAIVSGVGAILGAVVGIVFGVLVVTATPSDILDNLAVPWLSIGVLVVVAMAAGLVAGFLPARRAGKLDVLDAIAS
ncbi:MAG: ABC transporter permease [Acidimicrobiales bacterium]